MTEWFDFADPNYDALPVRRFELENRREDSRKNAGENAGRNTEANGGENAEEDAKETAEENTKKNTEEDAKENADETADARWTLTDGHTRAFVALLAGADELRVVHDADDLGVATYRRCVEWCRDEGVTELSDLAGRVLNADDFVEKWVARCRSFADE